MKVFTSIESRIYTIDWIAEQSGYKRGYVSQLALRFTKSGCWPMPADPNSSHHWWHKKDAERIVEILKRRAAENQTEEIQEPTKTRTPTSTLRGTWERVEVYRKRFEAGEFLYHRLDNPHGVHRDETTGRRKHNPNTVDWCSVEEQVWSLRQEFSEDGIGSY